MSSEKNQLGQEIALAERLSSLVKQSGWGDVMGILAVKWTEAFEEIQNCKGNGDISILFKAQATMKVIDDLLHQIGVKVGFGEKAKIDFKNRFDTKE